MFRCMYMSDVNPRFKFIVGDAGGLGIPQRPEFLSSLKKAPVHWQISRRRAAAAAAEEGGAVDSEYGLEAVK